MARRHAARLLILLALVLHISPCASGQGPTIPTTAPRGAGSAGTLLGPSPGALPRTAGLTPASQMLSGRVGSSVPRVPSTITRPGQGDEDLPLQDSIVAPPAIPSTEVPLLGPLTIPSAREDQGPADGMTLDMLLERLTTQNLALLARRYELPQAEADILTAGLRANPVLYGDSQLIPYGSYSRARPGGPLQYDVNVTYPIDVTHKRRARVQVATQARRVLEAQYQDAVRLQIDNLYSAYAEVLGARETIRFAEAARSGLEFLLDRTRRLHASGIRTLADVSHLEALFEGAEIELLDAHELLRTATRNLGVLLNLPGPEAETLRIRGTIRETSPPPPPVDELIRIALDSRPDVAAFRLGMARAEAEVKLAKANSMSDVFLVYQPFTYQDNSPFGRESATSWALGATVPVPLFNRNQGNIQRAKINVSQTAIELEEQKQLAANDVRQAERQYALTRKALERIEAKLLPAAQRARDDAYRLYIRGEEEAIVYLNAQREYNEAARQYRDMLVRHRRSMLRINTAVGLRILP